MIFTIFWMRFLLDSSILIFGSSNAMVIVVVWSQTAPIFTDAKPDRFLRLHIADPVSNHRSKIAYASIETCQVSSPASVYLASRLIIALKETLSTIKIVNPKSTINNHTLLMCHPP
jgi:hypothetical protein